MDKKPETNESLYERVGGEAGVERLVTAFYAAVLADPKLAPFFREVAIDKLKRMQREFFTAALDGPATYSGRPIAHVHHGRRIKASHMGRFVGHLLNIIEDYGLTEAERDGIISRINIYADEILGGGGLDG